MRKILIMTLLGTVLSANAFAQPAASPVVVELFTSQSCSSCVPAAIYFEELARREDVVALGWHVDYWNSLQTRDGRWVDPYSSGEYTARQRDYNRNLRATNSVYTPQMVIGGASEAVGSSRAKVSGLIDEANRNVPNASIAATLSDGAISIRISAGSTSEAYLVYFDPTADTKVSGGENAGVNFVDVNIVTGIRKLGTVNGETSFEAALPDDSTRCAIIVQEPDLGKISAAQYCPAS